jgi:hypothetical protein
MSELALESRKPSAHPVRSATGLPLAAANDSAESLMRLAIERGTGVDAMERLLAMRRELHAERAKAEFDAAMAAFQSECPAIVKAKSVPDRSGRTAYKYAPLEDVEVVIRPLTNKHGFHHTFDTDVSSQQGWIIARCIVTHVGGHSRETQVKLPLGTKTPIMSETQAYAAALTFATRRALQNAYGLVITGEDQDGRQPAERTTGPAMATPKTRDWMISKLADIRQEAFDYAINRGWIMPDEPLEAWPLDHVPVTASGLETLRKEILE